MVIGLRRSAVQHPYEVAAWRHMPDIAGQAFNLGGGPANAVSLRDVIGQIESMIGRRVDLAFGAWRPGDQRWFVADASRARNVLGMPPPIRWQEGLSRLAAFYAGERASLVEAAN